MMYLNTIFKSIKRNQNITRHLALVSLCSFFQSQALAAVPEISHINDQEVQQSELMIVQPGLDNQYESGTTNWSIAYGPDGVSVDPISGTIRWQIPTNLPSESFHVGVRATNLDGSSQIETFIVHVGVTDIVYVGPNESVKNFTEAFSAWQSPGINFRNAGTTFVVRSGRYSGNAGYIGLTSAGSVQHPPAGNASQYTTVIAEEPGEAILENKGGVWLKGVFGDASYIAIKGFHIDKGRLFIDGNGCSDENCNPHHIKIIRNGIELVGGDLVPGHQKSHHILFENNYSYGGQRTKFLAYKSSKSIFRRNVARFDYNADANGPTNTFAFYTSMDIIAQNNIAVDSDSFKFVAPSQNSGEFGCPTTAGDSRGTWDRNLQLNSEHIYGNIDRQSGQCDAIIRDAISWDNRAMGSLIMTRAPALFDHMTIGNYNPQLNVDVAFNGWPGTEVRGFTNAILHNIQTNALFEGFSSGSISVDRGSLTRWGIGTINLTDFNGVYGRRENSILEDTITNNNPIWSENNPNGGLRYIVRAEPRSNLSGKAADGLDIGAKITTFKGYSGTMWGESNSEEETNKPSWPFPFQEKIAEKMRAFSYTGPTWSTTASERNSTGNSTLSGNRGFARSNTNLTHYVWGYMGSSVPPMNVGASPGAQSAILRWDPQAEVDANKVASYAVYDYDPATQSVSNRREVGLTNSTLITGLENNTAHYFVVTVQEDGKTESGWSYPVEVTPSAGPRPMPPTLNLRDEV